MFAATGVNRNSLVLPLCLRSSFRGGRCCQGKDTGEQSRIYLSQEAIIYDRNACPPANPSRRAESARTSCTDGDNTGLTTSSAASTAGHVPRLRSYAVCWLEVLQQLRHKTPMPIVQRAESWKELLPQLRSSVEVLDADGQGLGAFFAHLQKPCSSPILFSSLVSWSLRM